jgi:response regulator RpfG family c-di-GMP phosphodiesterase
MNNKVLFVDDDGKVLASFKRNLGGIFDLTTASSGTQGLEVLRTQGPFAVVISDLKMPGMDGLAFLSQVREQHPNTIRVMLTGYADLETAMTAVNENQIFRFLAKPCDNKRLVQTLEACVEQHRLVMAERELLQGTLSGSIRVLTEMLSLLKPEVYGRVSRIVPYVRGLSKALHDPRHWQTETAARLALLGFIVLPDKIIRRLNLGRQLSPEEHDIFSRHTEVAVKLISNIPRMGSIAKIITYQDKHYDGTGPPLDTDLRREDIPLGARILKVALDFDTLVSSGGHSKKETLATMRRGIGVYDPLVLGALEQVLGDEAKYHIISIPVVELQDRMILMEDIYLSRGGKRVKVLSRGQEINLTTKEYLGKYLDQGYIGKSVTVIKPLTAASPEGLVSNEPE